MTGRYVEHPMFVPFGDGHLASILTMPSAEPRGVVVLLQGLGAARSHKNRVWTRTARALADRRIASMRMDYPEMGDSTGTLHADLAEPPLAEVEAVIQVALEAAAVDRLAFVGNCMGARTAFALASRHETCITVASILLGNANPLLRGQGFSASGWAKKRTAKGLPGATRALRRVLPGVHLEQPLRLLPQVESVVGSRGGFFLFFGKPEVTGRFERAIVRVASEANGSATPRTEVRSIAAVGTSGFRVPVPLQPVLIDSVVEWMDSVFPGGEGAVVPASVNAAPQEGVS